MAGAVYDDLYRRHRDLYSALGPMFERSPAV
jgi:hypothetical protein